MVEKTAGSVLGQKVSVQRHGPDANLLSAGQALRRSLSRAADGLWSLAADARVECDKVLPQEDCIAHLRRGDLFLLIRNAAGQSGLAVFDPPFVNSVIEVQTLGRVLPIDCEEREFTRTDAAMIAPLLDTALPQLEGMNGQGEGLGNVVGYSFVRMVEDVHAASLLLDASQYHVIDLVCQLADGLRAGRAVFLFPRAPAREKEVPGNEKRDSGALNHAVETAPAEMKAVLFRIRLPLAKAGALSEGQVFTCPVACIESTELVAKGGYLVTTAKLGQLNGMRAVRFRPSSRLTGDVAAENPAEPPAQSAEDIPTTGEAFRQHLDPGADASPEAGELAAASLGDAPPVDPALQNLPPEI